MNDDPAFFYFSKQLNCRFGSRKTPGGANGVGNQIIGPIDPDCDIDPSGALHFKPNPFNNADENPLLVDPNTGALGFGGAELPARAASEYRIDQRGSDTASQGVYYPSPAFRRFLKSGDPSVFDQNFSQNELAWNRGGSQQDEKELKELYLDMEFFDSRLWIRFGKQNIVWGKTELFRTTDQFNPVDLALASLPSLEESRIALWSVRGIWSFYDVGPMEDVRLELAANIDDNEPADIGRCGEPFTALVACNKTTALWAHGLFGVALAGEHRPEGWWKSPSGLEYGARLEWRMGRFSFQLSDFYGFEDFPYVNRINSYQRGVDVETGRPLKASAVVKGGALRTVGGKCVTGFEKDCLPIQSNLSIGSEDPKSSDLAANRGDYNPTNSGISGGDNATKGSREDVLKNFSSNMQIFAAICATSIGFNSVDLSACGQSIFNSQKRVPTLDIDITEAQRKTGLSVAQLLANTLGGNNSARLTVQAGFTNGAVVPYVPLNADPCDAFLSDNDGGCTAILGRGRTLALGAGTLNVVLTDEQEALLGCGPFWGTDCEADGIDLLNMEASVAQQSWPGIEGDYGDWVRERGYAKYSIGGRDGDGDLLPIPGTRPFKGGTPGGRWYKNELRQLPGARGPGDKGYNPLVDGCVRPRPGACAAAMRLQIPIYNDPASGTVDGFRMTGVPDEFRDFKSEMAALSWNLLQTLVAFSSATDPTDPDLDDFDPGDPASLDRGQCSFAQPQFCSSVISFLSITGAQRNSLRAGGNGDYGRRDFQWHAGGEGVLEYQKRNVLGFSTDFAEDVTKSNWSMEATWISNVRFTDNNSLNGVNTADTFNMTVSVDRPTFINFLNQNRTFFFNSQVFFQYINNYKSGFVNNGPFNMLGTFTVQTGYFQDRLLPGVTFVYDMNSNSGAARPAITYRFTENFSATVGMNFFWGRWEYEDTAIAPLGTIGNEVGSLAYRDGVENALSVVRERDEIFLRLRYTF
jgi:hypothetical protein